MQVCVRNYMALMKTSQKMYNLFARLFVARLLKYNKRTVGEPLPYLLCVDPFFVHIASATNDTKHQSDDIKNKK